MMILWLRDRLQYFKILETPSLFFLLPGISNSEDKWWHYDNTRLHMPSSSHQWRCWWQGWISRWYSGDCWQEHLLHSQPLVQMRGHIGIWEPWNNGEGLRTFPSERDICNVGLNSLNLMYFTSSFLYSRSSFLLQRTKLVGIFVAPFSPEQEPFFFFSL